MGTSESGGEPVPKPGPSPPSGNIVPPDPPFPELERSEVAPEMDPDDWVPKSPGGGIPGGPNGDVSEPDRRLPTGGPPIGPAPDPGGAPDGIIGPSPPRPKEFVLLRPDCWFMLGGGPTGPGPPEDWPTGYIP